MPAVKLMMVEVALVLTPKLVVGVNGKKDARPAPVM